MKCLRVLVLLGAAFAAIAPQALALDIINPGDVILAIDLDGLSDVSGSSYPANENPPLLIDGDINTKYLNFGELDSGFIVTPTASSIVRSFTLSTANDAIERDPTSYALFGTNDAIMSTDNSFGNLENWTLISEGGLALPDDRFTTGPLVAFPNTTSYSSYRMIFPTVKNADAANSMQLSEAAFFASADGTGANLLTGASQILAIDTGAPLPASSYPAAEPPAAALDRVNTTKYLNGGAANSGFIVTPSTPALPIQSIVITTANDVPARDPASYELYGTNEAIVSTDNSDGMGENWTLISSGALALPEERQVVAPPIAVNATTAYSSYRLVFPTIKDEVTSNLMQVADVQFTVDEPLTLEVNRDTGEVTINTSDTFTFSSYAISSASGGLNDAEWDSIAATGADPDDTWVEVSSESGLLEEEDGPGGADNGITGDAGGSISLGNIWLPTPFEDLQFAVRDANGIRIADGITYIGNNDAPILRGDFNVDGVVNASDYALFSAGLGGQHDGLSAAEAYLRGDLDGDGDTDIFDYNAFVAIVNGASGALLGNPAVPEPSSLLLVGLGSILLGCRRFRRAGLRAVPVVALGLATAIVAEPAEAQQLFNFTNLGVPTVTTPDPIENEASGPINLFDDTFLDGGAGQFNAQLFVANYGDPVFPSAQYAGLGAAPKTVFMDFGSSISPGWFAYAQRSGGDPAADRVGKFEFWFSDTDFGEVLPATAPDAVYDIKPDDDRVVDSFFRPYTLGGEQSGRYVAMRLTVSDLSAPRPTNNIGGHEFRFMSGPSDIVLEVDRSNGAMTLKNSGASAQAVDITAYEIESGVGALDADGFVGVGDDAGFTGWAKGGGSNPNRLADAIFDSDTTLAAGASLPLGNGYNELVKTEDLSLRFTNTLGQVYDGVVQYVGVAPPGFPGDYNDNGVVDAADYTVWRDALGSTMTLPNDPTPGVVNRNDYNLWKANFGNVASGAGLGAASAVPEPSSLVLIGLASAVCAALGVRRR